MDPLEQEIKEALAELARREQAKKNKGTVEDTFEEELRRGLAELARQMHANDSGKGEMNFDRMAEKMIEVILESGKLDITSGQITGDDLRLAISREMECDEKSAQRVLDFIGQLISQFRLR